MSHATNSSNHGNYRCGGENFDGNTAVMVLTFCSNDNDIQRLAWGN